MSVLDPADWRPAVEAALADGHTHFVTLMGIDDGGAQLWLRLRSDGGDDRVLCVSAEAPVPTLLDLLPAVDWYEREAAEMLGVTVSGRDLQPLLLPADSAPPLRRGHLLAARQETPWPGEKEPGGVTSRRRHLPPGVAGGGR